MSQTIATAEAVFKQEYPPEEIRRLIYKDNPLMALMPKDTNFGGELSKEPIMIGTGQNRSPNFTAANVVNSSNIYKAFLVTRVSNYATGSVGNEAMLASESDADAFLSILKNEMDGTLESLTRPIAMQMYRSGTGSVGRLSASAVVNDAAVAIQLASPEDGTNLDVNIPIAFSAADGGTIKSGTAFIVKLNRIQGNFFVSATVGGSPAALTSLVSTAAASDFIYTAAGDLNNTVSGLQSWLPGDLVTSTPFFGVDRTVDSRLAGIRYDGSAQSIEEALLSAATLVAREGGKPKHCFMNYSDYLKLNISLGSKSIYFQTVQVMVNDPKVAVGFEAMQITGPAGPIQVIADRNCPVGKAFLLDMSTWKMKSLGEIVRVFNGDSLNIIRDLNSDALNFRCFSYGNISCRAPGWNAQVLLPA